MAHPLEFGPFRLDSGPDRLRRGSEEIPIRPKTLRVLAYLARRPGRLVTKDELREQVWGATHVSDTRLRVTVREIRAALGERPDGSEFLETVPGQGYRFRGSREEGGAPGEPDARGHALSASRSDALPPVALDPRDELLEVFEAPSPFRVIDVAPRLGADPRDAGGDVPGQVQVQPVVLERN